jgi:hypothetical protein
MSSSEGPGGAAAHWRRDAADEMEDATAAELSAGQAFAY